MGLQLCHLRLLGRQGRFEGTALKTVELISSLNFRALGEQSLLQERSHARDHGDPAGAEIRPRNSLDFVMGRLVVSKTPTTGGSLAAGCRAPPAGRGK